MLLGQQLAFLRELDKLKHILRQTHLVDGSRRENTAEHSWHATMAALILAEHANGAIDILRVLKMLLIHDIVEIDAGDTFAFDSAGYEDKFEREQRAADRIFGLLPEDTGSELKALWLEFEAAESTDAQYANAIDKIMPYFHNIWTEGQASWAAHAITYEQVYDRNIHGVGDGAPHLWQYIQDSLEDAVEQGWIKPSQ